MTGLLLRNVRAAAVEPAGGYNLKGIRMKLVLGIDVACRSAHQATLATADGKIVWEGDRFFTTPQDLERLWQRIGAHEQLQVVLEPTRNAWVPLAAWLARRGATIIVVPTTQSADLRAYYSKHTKNDRLDSRILARLPLLHPEGLRAHAGLGPGDPLRRAVKLRSSLVKRRTGVLLRLDAYLELLGPAWYDALGSDYGKAALAVLERYGNPTAILKLGRARLSAFLIRRSRGAWREQRADLLIAAARQSTALWPDGLDFEALAADIAIEAAQAMTLTAQIHAVEERIAALYREADPRGIVASAPGAGKATAPAIYARLGDARRFKDLSAVRSFAGLTPRISQSGTMNAEHGLTKAGDPLLREAAFQAADHARRIDPQLAAKYKRLMEHGSHHNSALCHIAATLLTRIAACLRTDQPYVIRDINGTAITADEGRHIVQHHHKIDPAIRAANRQQRLSQTQKTRTGRESQESPSAPTSQPAKHHPKRTRQIA